MRNLLFFLLVFWVMPLKAQYYLRGDVKDEKGTGLGNVKIFVHSAKSMYATGASGSFGIVVNQLYDSITLSLEGYETKTLRVKSDLWQSITLKISALSANKNQTRLNSLTKDFNQTARPKWFTGDETYFQLIENNFITTDKYPNTSFALNVNKASYSNIRRFINQNSVVPPDAVKLEEMINYFNLHYREPENKTSIFRSETFLTDCPWDAKQQLLYLNVSAKKLPLDAIPPGNFVFLIDVSGSMDMPNRLPLLKAAFQLFVKNLRQCDTVSIVIYGGTVGVYLQPTGGDQKDKINRAIEELEAAGDTPGESAIRLAYQVAQRTFNKEGNNRVILATDGDFNVGETSEKALDELITKQRQSGVYLTCLGVGMGNFKDSKLQILAKKGNGNYAYLDDIQEAEKTLVQELTQTMYAVAGNVTLSVNFNSGMINEYRLIGFDNKRDALSDEESILEGGEVGSGNSTLILFQIKPTSKNLQLIKEGDTENIGLYEINYTNAKDTLSKKESSPILLNYVPFQRLEKDLQMAAAISMFGMRLKTSSYLGAADWPQIQKIAAEAADKSNYLQNEFLQIINKARKIYGSKKKKRKDTEE